MATANQRLKRIRVKTKRAKQHLRNLEARLRRFYNSKPYKIRAERDPQTRQPVYYLESIKPVPVAVNQLIADTLSNLRSALDHLAYQLVHVGTKGVGITTNKKDPFSHVSFPIYDSATNYKTNRFSKVKGASNAAIKAIDALKPYKGGNDGFWLLDQLNNVEKHRCVVGLVEKTYMDLSGIFQEMQNKLFSSEPTFQQWIGHPDLRPPQVFIKLRLDKLEVGSELFRGLPDGEMHDAAQFAFVVAFAEPQIVERQAVYETLRDMTNFVDDVIQRFKPHLA